MFDADAKETMRRTTCLLLVLLAAACQRSQPSSRPAADAATAAQETKPAGRIVFDFLANRPLAEVEVGANLIMDASSADFWKYIDGGWKSSWIPGVRDGEHRVALVQGVAGVVRFPLVPAQGEAAGDRRVAFTVRPAAPRQMLTLFLNEQPLTNLAIEDSYKTYEVALPEAKLAAGENALRFHFRSAGTLAGKHTAAAFERILVGPRGAADPGPSPRLGASLALQGDTRPALASPLPARFSWHVTVPAATFLELAYGARDQARPPTRFVVRALSDGEAARELWSATGGATWQSARIDLAPLAGKTVRLDFLMRDGGGAFAAPRIVADAPDWKPPRTPLPEHILVWMVDTLRADRLAAWNPSTRTKTPAFDQLCREATRFDHMTVQGNYSLPSHTSLLTGVLPPGHGMWEDKDRLSTKLPLISELFQKAGFATAIFSSNGYVSDKWGFKRGWDAYRNFIREEKPNGATEIWKAAKPWLAEQAAAKRRTFMYLATVEPHVGYNPPERYLKPYWPKPYRGPIRAARTSEQLYQIKIGRLKPSDEDKRYLEALYEAEVTQNDEAFAQVVADLKQMGLYEQTAIVIVSDHGDEFYDHGSVGHGHSLYQELVDVPFVVRYPTRFPPGKVVHADLDLTDVYATLLDLGGLPLNEEAQGDSMVPFALDDGPRMERAAEAFHMGAIRSLRVGRWKLITWTGARLALYDLETDPREQKDLAKDHPIALRYLRNLFSLQHAYQLRWRKSKWGTPTNLTPAFAQDVGM